MRVQETGSGRVSYEYAGTWYADGDGLLTGATVEGGLDMYFVMRQRLLRHGYARRGRAHHQSPGDGAGKTAHLVLTHSCRGQLLSERGAYGHAFSANLSKRRVEHVPQALR